MFEEFEELERVIRELGELPLGASVDELMHRFQALRQALKKAKAGAQDARIGLVHAREQELEKERKRRKEAEGKLASAVAQVGTLERMLWDTRDAQHHLAEWRRWAGSVSPFGSDEDARVDLNKRLEELATLRKDAILNQYTRGPLPILKAPAVAPNSVIDDLRRRVEALSESDTAWFTWAAQLVGQLHTALTRESLQSLIAEKIGGLAKELNSRRASVSLLEKHIAEWRRWADQLVPEVITTVIRRDAAQRDAIFALVNRAKAECHLPHLSVAHGDSLWRTWAVDLEANLSASGPGEPPNDVEVRASVSRYFDKADKLQKEWQEWAVRHVTGFGESGASEMSAEGLRAQIDRRLVGVGDGWVTWARGVLRNIGRNSDSMGLAEVRRVIEVQLGYVQSTVADRQRLNAWRTWACIQFPLTGLCNGNSDEGDMEMRNHIVEYLAKLRAVETPQSPQELRGWLEKRNAEWRTWALELPLLSQEERDRYLAAGDEAIRSLVSMRIMVPMAPVAPSDQDLGRALAVSMNRILLWRRWAEAEFNLAHVDDNADGDVWIMRQVIEKTRFAQGKLAKIRGIVG